jgi:hypothetical protein
MPDVAAHNGMEFGCGDVVGFVVKCVGFRVESSDFTIKFYKFHTYPHTQISSQAARQTRPRTEINWSEWGLPAGAGLFCAPPHHTSPFAAVPQRFLLPAALSSFAFAMAALSCQLPSAIPHASAMLSVVSCSLPTAFHGHKSKI